MGSLNAMQTSRERVRNFIAALSAGIDVPYCEALSRGACLLIQPAATRREPPDGQKQERSGNQTERGRFGRHIDSQIIVLGSAPANVGDVNRLVVYIVCGQSLVENLDEQTSTQERV